MLSIAVDELHTLVEAMDWWDLRDLRFRLFSDHDVDITRPIDRWLTDLGIDTKSRIVIAGMSPDVDKAAAAYAQLMSKGLAAPTDVELAAVAEQAAIDGATVARVRFVLPLAHDRRIRDIIALVDRVMWPVHLLDGASFDSMPSAAKTQLRKGHHPIGLARVIGKSLVIDRVRFRGPRKALDAVTETAAELARREPGPAPGSLSRCGGGGAGSEVVATTALWLCADTETLLRVYASNRHLAALSSIQLVERPKKRQVLAMVRDEMATRYGGWAAWPRHFTHFHAAVPRKTGVLTARWHLTDAIEPTLTKLFPEPLSVATWAEVVATIIKPLEQGLPITPDEGMGYSAETLFLAGSQLVRRNLRGVEYWPLLLGAWTEVVLSKRGREANTKVRGQLPFGGATMDIDRGALRIELRLKRSKHMPLARVTFTTTPPRKVKIRIGGRVVCLETPCRQILTTGEHVVGMDGKETRIEITGSGEVPLGLPSE